MQMNADYVRMSFGSMALQPQLDYSKVSQVHPSEPRDNHLGRLLAQAGTLARLSFAGKQ